MKSLSKRKPIRLHIKIEGKVQGVGFRPTVYRYATERNLAGWVTNTSTGVIVEVEGEEEKIYNFIYAVTKNPPPRADIIGIKTTEIPIKNERSFQVIPSILEEKMKTMVSPDIATCKDCLRELFDRGDKRYLYPFINCTNCGPRFTIIQNIPYDRPNITMKKFTMCDLCQKEYDDPSNRRFHAQPNACKVCGPKVRLIANCKSQIANLSEGTKALQETIRLVSQGKIIAIKGLGGFHIACDALNDEAVRTLRSRKYREDKPFALMAKDLGIIKQYCEVSPEEEKLLLSWKCPIVILKKKLRKPNTEYQIPISKYVAPNNKYLGFMLPYTPLHHMLFKLPITNYQLLILVMTSGNISDEPIAYNNDEGMERLKDIADYFLIHDRDIYIRCDDSVTRVFLPTRKEYIIRRSKGYVPDPIRIRIPRTDNQRPILACGGHSKNTFAFAYGDEIILSHHIGDMENIETYNSFVNGIEHFKKLLEVEPEIIAHDLHPDYLSTQYAKELSTFNSQLSTIPIQHHHAHIASVMADNLLDNRKVIGLAFDGTGLGSDGKLWGSEFLVVDYSDFERIAHLKYIPLPGGEKAIKEPWRIAVSYLYFTFGDEFLSLDIDFVRRLDKNKWKILQKMIDEGINSALTSSMGRLFDAVSSLIGIRDVVNYEGQAAIELEMILSENRVQSTKHRNYNYSIEEADDIYLVDTSGIIREIVEDLENSLLKETISLKFHQTIVELTVDMCKRIRNDIGLKEVALSGGVFQNMFLLTKTYERLTKEGFRVYIHEKVPTNDGGLSLGQAVIAGHKVKEWLS